MSTPRTLNSFISATIARLAPEVGEREARASLRMIFESVKGWSPVDVAIKGGEPVSPFVSGKVDDIVNRMLRHEPLQYILGEAYWHGLHIRVTPDVLIPRPETSELVDIIVKEYAGRADLRIADICTGSGCIACALARNLPFASVTALDISSKALDVARQNADNLRVGSRISFVEADILREGSLPDGPYDIIVANPPYIAEDERGTMERNVLLFEPAQALFVPDDDPLIFYRAISHEGRRAIAPGGRLYLEINPIYAARLADHLTQAGWHDVEIVRDIHSTQRFISAVAAPEGAQSE